MTLKTMLGAAIALLLAVPAAAQDGGTLEETQKRLHEVIARVTPAYVFVGGGSAVCISPDGWILTNHHVAGEKREWPLRFSGGRQAVADLVGWHPLDDVAVLKIREGADFPFVPLGDSDHVRVGDPVIAVGNPFNLGAQNWEPSVAYGIVSALHVYLDNPGYKDAIQTDAQINPGNSGGPLLTMKGEVIGINGRIDIKRFVNRVNSGIGYAIPSNQIARFLPHFKAGGRQWGGYLEGVQVGECGDDRFDHTGEYGDGTFIHGIDEGCPADKAGFKEGDILYSIGGHGVTNNNRFFGIVGSYPTGSVVPVKARRWNAEKKGFEGFEARVLLGKIEDMKEFYAQAGNRYYGFTPNYFHQGPGFSVGAVDPGSPGEKAGLKRGDLIVEANGKKLANWVEFRQLMGSRKPGDAVKLTVRRLSVAAPLVAGFRFKETEKELVLVQRDLDQDQVGPQGRRRPPPKKDDKKKDEDDDDEDMPPKKEQKEEPKKEEPKQAP